MSDALFEVQLAVSRIEQSLAAVEKLAEGSVRTAETLVGLMEDRVMASVEAVKDRVDAVAEMGKETAATVKDIDRWRLVVTNRALGVFIGGLGAGSGLTAALVKVLGS